jgi:hypothetical protein
LFNSTVRRPIQKQTLIHTNAHRSPTHKATENYIAMPNQNKQPLEATQRPAKPPEPKQWGSMKDKQIAQEWLVRISQKTENDGTKDMTNIGEEFLYYMQDYIT